MLNLPMCINNDEIPLLQSLCAPFQSLVELELMFQLYSKVNPKLEGVNLGTITSEDIETYTCGELLEQTPQLQMYCGLCHYCSSNVLMRLDNEIALLNHYYNNTASTELSDQLFEYYMIGDNKEQLFITRDIYTIIKNNFDSYENKYAILSNMSEEYGSRASHVKNIIDHIISTKSQTDFNKVLKNLQKNEAKSKPSSSSEPGPTRKKSERKKATSTPTMSSQQNSIFELLENHINSQKTTSNQNVTKQLKQDSVPPLQDSVFPLKEDGSPINVGLVSESVTSETAVDAFLSNEGLVNESVLDCQIDSKSNDSGSDLAITVSPTITNAEANNGPNMNAFNADQIINESIVGGAILIQSNPSSVTTIVRGNIYTYSYDNTSEDQSQVMQLIISNSNIWKLIDNITSHNTMLKNGNIKNFLDISLAQTSAHKTNEDVSIWYNSLSNTDRKDLYLKSKLKYIRKIKNTYDYNVTLNFTDESINPLSIIEHAIITGLFEKYSLTYHSHTSTQLKFKAEVISERESLDRIFNIARKLLRQANKTPYFEVQING